MYFGERYKVDIIDRRTGKKVNFADVTYKKATWKEFHTDNHGEGLWYNDRQIVGTMQFSVAGCKTEKAAIAKIRNFIKGTVYDYER